MAFPEIDRDGTIGNAVEQLAVAVNDWSERIIALLRLEQNFSDGVLYDPTKSHTVALFEWDSVHLSH